MGKPQKIKRAGQPGSKKEGKNMAIKTNNNSQGSVGIFDGLPATPQAGKASDTTTTQKAGQENKDGATNDGNGDISDNDTKAGEQTGGNDPDNNSDTDENNSQNDGEDTENNPGNEEKPIIVNGRNFANIDELATAYSNSSAEGIRLASAEKYLKSEIDALKKQIIEYEDKSDSEKFPGEMTDEQLAELQPFQVQKYFYEKDKWEKEHTTRVEARKAYREQLKKQDEEIKLAAIQNESAMEADVKKYPRFSELKPLMGEIVKMTPHIGNRADTPYLSYIIAVGLDALNAQRLGKVKSEESLKKAKKEAENASTATAKPGNAGKPANQTKAPSDIVSAYKARMGAGL